MIYRNKARDTLWKYIKRRVKYCGRVMHRLKAVDGGLLLIIDDEQFTKEFEKVG